MVGLFGTTAFVTITIFSLVWVNGLTYDKATGSFEQTSVIAIETKIKNVSVFINDELVSDSLPLQERNLTAGQYKLKITRKNFQTLRQTINLKVGQLELIEDIVMVATKPLVTSLDVDYKIIDVGNYSTGLSLLDGKLYEGTDFITRFANDPKKIYKFNFTYLYIINNEIRLFIPETSQDFLIISSSQADITINTKPFSWSFAVLDGDSKYLVNVVESSEASVDSAQ